MLLTILEHCVCAQLRRKTKQTVRQDNAFCLSNQCSHLQATTCIEPCSNLQRQVLLELYMPRVMFARFLFTTSSHQEIT